MPDQRENKYEITFKNLRRREIPCLVIAVPQKNTLAHSDNGPYNAQNKNCSKILKCLKQKLNRITTTPKKKSKSLSCLDRKSELTFKATKPISYKDKGLEIENTPRKRTTIDVLNSTADITEVDIPAVRAETSNKRIYRKKAQVGVTITPITDSPGSTSTVETFFGNPILTPDIPRKRIYRKKLKIPAVPHNTPVLCRGSNGDSLSSTSFPGHSEVITVGKRGRGRPRLTTPVVDYGEESTMSLGSDKGSTTRRSVYSWDSSSEDETNEVSEYELLRQKNIEENLKMLRELFNDQELDLNKKSPNTPKKRKSYSRVPLPPPRPRSQRIEIRKTTAPLLDFSKLDEKLAMSEAAFM